MYRKSVANAPIIDTTKFLEEVDRITRQRKAQEYKTRRDNRKTKQFKTGKKS